MGSIHRFVGSSAGSLMALMLTLGLTTDEIRNWTNELIRVYEFNMLSADSALLGFVDNLGFDDGHKVLAACRATLRRYCPSRGDMTTFEELGKITGRELVVCALNVHKQRHEYFSMDTTPRMHVAQACCMSMSLPLLFQPVWHNGCAYVDPVIGRNFPFDFPGACLEDACVLGLAVRRDLEAANNNNSHPTAVQKNNLHSSNSTPSNELGIMRFLSQLLGVMLQQSNDHTGKYKYTMVNIVLDPKVFKEPFRPEELGFEWNAEIVSSLSQAGYACIERVLGPKLKLWTPPPESLLQRDDRKNVQVQDGRSIPKNITTAP
jgi:predicted acylesterase/phospholipase RssA